MTRLFLSLVVLFSLGCSEVESLNEAESVSPDTLIQIAAHTCSSTKGAIVKDPTDMGSIGLYCAMTGDKAWSNETVFSKLLNQRYYLSNDEDWVIDGDEVMWGHESLSDKYTFFAYSPHNADKQYITPSIDTGELIIYYKVPTNSADQPDLMYALPRKNMYPQISGYVPLTFYHALSCVSFEVVSTTTTKITEIDITGVVSSGSLGWDYELATPRWSLDEGIDETFSVAVEDYTLNSNDSALVNTEQGYLMMIPQVLESGAQVTLTFSDGKQKNLLIPANSVWEAGLTYNYVIYLSEDDCDFLFNSTQLSNCYIINPNDGEATIFQIPIEDRINDFWKNYSGKNTKKIKADNEPSEYTASIIWEDFDDALALSYTILDDVDEKMAARLTLPANCKEGNLVFAVEQSDGSTGKDILWSWHIWVTDYNPYAIATANRAAIEENTEKEYTLTGYNGAVHRYIDVADAVDSVAVWSGIYKDKFIMDRNIGERDERTDTYGAGSVYYQFGRKDPFPGDCARFGNDSTSQTGRVSSGFDFFESVEYARDFFTAGDSSINNWTDETAGRSATYIWYDKNIVASGYTVGKSIFDPSPLGWRVPVSATWSSFTRAKNVAGTTTVGDYYYTGYRDALDKGELAKSQTKGCLWSSNQMNYETGYCFTYNSNKANSFDEFYVTYGFPIRAIEE